MTNEEHEEHEDTSTTSTTTQADMRYTEDAEGNERRTTTTVFAETGDPVLVGVDPQDMAVIINGLRELPGAVKQMAGAVQQLANNADKSPTKTGTTVVSVLSALFVVAAVSLLVWRLEKTVDEIQETQLEGQEIVEATYDCLNYTEEGDPAGECAQRTTGVITQFAAQLTEEVRCQSEVGFYLFITQNPELGVEPAPLSEGCLDFLKERAGG